MHIKNSIKHHVAYVTG